MERKQPKLKKGNGMVAYSSNPSIQEAKVGGSQVWGQPGIRISCLKKQKN
jgi:hypothetical protein